VAPTSCFFDVTAGLGSGGLLFLKKPALSRQPKVGRITLSDEDRMTWIGHFARSPVRPDLPGARFGWKAQPHPIPRDHNGKPPIRMWCRRRQGCAYVRHRVGAGLGLVARPAAGFLPPHAALRIVALFSGDLKCSARSAKWGGLLLAALPTVAAGRLMILTAELRQPSSIPEKGAAVGCTARGRGTITICISTATTWSPVSLQVPSHSPHSA
jgi:hypothetical protein